MTAIRDLGTPVQSIPDLIFKAMNLQCEVKKKAKVTLATFLAHKKIILCKDWFPLLAE